jgi:GNAT superfamily N-acetyltransferase
MNLTYEVIPDSDIEICRELCNELMVFQKSKTTIHAELLDKMNFDTRMVPTVQRSSHNHIVVVKDGEKPVAYIYSNIASKENYSTSFATFFDLNSVKNDVGCLAQFYIKEAYRSFGIGSKLLAMSVEWQKSFEHVQDFFVFVSNGNDTALDFYKRKGYSISHEILDGFITVMRSDREHL